MRTRSFIIISQKDGNGNKKKDSYTINQSVLKIKIRIRNLG
jgi:hypothetical protein